MPWTAHVVAPGAVVVALDTITGPAGPAGPPGADGGGGPAGDLPDMVGLPSTFPPEGFVRLIGRTDPSGTHSLQLVAPDETYIGMLDGASADATYVAKFPLILTGKGALAVSYDNGTDQGVEALGVGADGQKLTADSTSDYGVAWTNDAGGPAGDIPDTIGSPGTQTPPDIGFTHLYAYTNEGIVGLAPSVYVMNADGNYTSLVVYEDLDGYLRQTILTTGPKGSLITGVSDGGPTSVSVLPPGTDGQILTADSTSEYGIRWIDPP